MAKIKSKLTRIVMNKKEWTPGQVNTIVSVHASLTCDSNFFGQLLKAFLTLINALCRSKDFGEKKLKRATMSKDTLL